MLRYTGARGVQTSAQQPASPCVSNGQSGIMQVRFFLTSCELIGEVARARVCFIRVHHRPQVSKPACRCPRSRCPSCSSICSSQTGGSASESRSRCGKDCGSDQGGQGVPTSTSGHFAADLFAHRQHSFIEISWCRLSRKMCSSTITPTA